MLGLVSYDSSSEEETQAPTAQTSKDSVEQKVETIEETAKKLEIEEATIEDTRTSGTSEIESRPLNGPILGPEQPLDDDEPPASKRTRGQLSPNSTYRALMQDLTLPPVPNLELPGSPPGSPDPVASSKTAQFLSLKKQGVHFNEKLAGSSSLKNPSLFLKLREHTGVDERNQYATSLSSDIWDPESLPSWAYKEELYKTQQALRSKISQSKQADKNRSIQFVSSTLDA